MILNKTRHIAVDIEGEIKGGDPVYVIWKNTRECIK
jgi:hypothetical protein